MVTIEEVEQLIDNELRSIKEDIKDLEKAVERLGKEVEEMDNTLYRINQNL